MSASLTTLANGLWWLSSLPQSVAFHLSARNVAEAQEQRLLRLLRRNARTAYGKRFDFASIRTAAQFQARVPLASYDDYQSWIDRIAAGESGVLTADSVLLLEPTSGSTAATKLIPYTATLKAEFQRAISTWIVDLFAHDPRLLVGKAYWSVTPVTRRRERTSGGLPVGFEDDAEYLGGWQRALLDEVMAVPAAVRWIAEMESFRYVTLLFLLRCRSLALVSVWNPTFFTLLIERLDAWGPQLIEDIAQGTISPPARMDPALLAQFTRRNRADRRRAKELTGIFCESRSPAERHARLWPNLRWISCWADGQASPYASQLARLFPQARMQGKGLIATEGVVSLPLAGREGAALAYRSHFYEFLPEVGDHPRLAHALERGARYSLAITTGGGLYRYQLHDLVECTGFYRGCPLLRFIGRADRVSDWFGEKLNALHVERALAAALGEDPLPAAFTMLACEADLAPPGYALFIEAPGRSEEELRAIAREIERSLLLNFHYRYCRDLDQLAPLRVFRITEGGAETYMRACREKGLREGNIKPTALHKDSGWSRRFRGGFVHPPEPPGETARITADWSSAD